MAAFLLIVAIIAPRASPTNALTLDVPILSPYWSPSIQRWSPYIESLSEAYGFHPDFIAAVIQHEADDRQGAISHMGAVGLMGAAPTGAALQWRPSSEELLIPAANLRWGMAILSYVVQQSGGDLYTALAAYNGGWDHVNSRLPREYAARVLDSYGRALIARAGLSPQMAHHWTVAVEIRAGNVPAEPLLVLGDKSISGLQALASLRSVLLRPSAAYTIYAFANESGRTFYVRGYAVPIGLSELVGGESDGTFPDELEGPLRARMGEKSVSRPPGNPRVLLACLPSLTRLRGQPHPTSVDSPPPTTRWYSPSNCPAAER